MTMEYGFGYVGEWTSGDLAYLDTFSGLVKVVILGQRQNYNAVSPTARGDVNVVVRVTSRKNSAYKTGEILSIPEKEVIRRDAVYTRDGMYRVRMGMAMHGGNLPVA